MQPSYTVSADDTIQNADKIQITLQDAHDAGDPIEFFDSIDYEYLPYKSYEYTSEYDGYECVGEGIAKYLLQKEVDALMDLLYMYLQQVEEQFGGTQGDHNVTEIKFSLAQELLNKCQGDLSKVKEVTIINNPYEGSHNLA